LAKCWKIFRKFCERWGGGFFYFSSAAGNGRVGGVVENEELVLCTGGNRYTHWKRKGGRTHARQKKKQGKKVAGKREKNVSVKGTPIGKLGRKRARGSRTGLVSPGKGEKAPSVGRRGQEDDGGAVTQEVLNEDEAVRKKKTTNPGENDSTKVGKRQSPKPRKLQQSPSEGAGGAFGKLKKTVCVLGRGG